MNRRLLRWTEQDKNDCKKHDDRNTPHHQTGNPISGHAQFVVGSVRHRCRSVVHQHSLRFEVAVLRFASRRLAVDIRGEVIAESPIVGRTFRNHLLLHTMRPSYFGGDFRLFWRRLSSLSSLLPTRSKEAVAHSWSAELTNAKEATRPRS